MDELDVARKTKPLAGSTTRRRALGKIAGGTLAAALAAGAGAAGRSASAQQGTPTAGGAGCGDPAPGTAVSVLSVEGVEVGTVTVAKVTDPFTGYRPNSPPARGNRFVLLSVSVENTGTNPWQFDPGRIFLQDADGFATYATGVDLGDPPVEPGFAYQEIPPATTAGGAVGFVLLKGVDPVRAFYSPSSDRLILLADLR
ncbi:MAG: hypothetical protein QOF01_175 [Thermomicrobiales bacterium]|jgi:hypothetical protein|nr:hypothetical protein [Thermomicrobiales bacterium]MEA2593706.1 hypothetical protein [Thermomicrobiales bacterium]